MQKFGAYLALALLCIGMSNAQTKTSTPNPPQPQTKTIAGLVRDISCPMQNKKSTSRHFDLKCAEACARNGAALGILTDDGIIYMPISDVMPDVNLQSKLMPFVGKYVRVSGEVYERQGTHAIAIKNITEDKTVKLNTVLAD